MPRREKPPSDDEIIERLRRHLDVLGLTHTREHVEEHLAWARGDQPAPSAFLERVLGDEAAHKLARRVERRYAMSGLPERKTLEAFDWTFQTGIDKPLVLELARLDFVRHSEDLVITGKAGTGKSHIVKALALRACQQQVSVRYAMCRNLLDDLYAGLGDGTYSQRLRGWAAPQLLVIDDVGLGQVKKRDDEPTAAHTLFALLDKRHGRLATAVTSNIRLGAWGRYLGDAALATAILDRLAMRAIRMDVDGPSYRQKIARDRAKERGSKLPDDDELRTPEAAP
jgi:DNA replication protein DnaC